MIAGRQPPSDLKAAARSHRPGTRRGGPSDATVEVLARQLEEMADPAEWRSIAAESSPGQVAAAASTPLKDERAAASTTIETI